RDLNLEIEKQETCQAYCEYMQKVGEMSYPVQAMVIWAIELAYNQAWQKPRQMVPPYDEFADRWGNTHFTDYVKQLEKQANQALYEADQETQKYLESAFVKIASLEKNFWQMAYNN
ncbi:MAG: TenA family transcriptional regulator, partial [Halothece sp. Uz-M2-17]|nr:TenA family transcriptional regulator [Halothece sp. Uz-M2-17]